MVVTKVCGLDGVILGEGYRTSRWDKQKETG